jgi:hypothetical protein
MREEALTNTSESDAHPSERLVREALSRITTSAIFARSERLERFLRFTVKKTLEGEANTLKEYLIGTQVYDRKPSYRPELDSIVRSEARRLRLKLREYYASTGKYDLVWIYYQPGSYVPRFQTQKPRPVHDTGTTSMLGQLLAQELVKRTLDVPAGNAAIDVQIVFEGTVRVLYPGSVQAKPHFESPIHTGTNKRHRRSKVFSMPLRNAR